MSALDTGLGRQPSRSPKAAWLLAALAAALLLGPAGSAQPPPTGLGPAGPLPSRLYRYDSLAAIPEGDFNAHAGAAARQWTLSIASGTSVSLTDTVRSDAVAAYRAVPLSAP